jgi:hypothetical protein
MYASTNIEFSADVKHYKTKNTDLLPESFCWKTTDPANQYKCGSCWAVSVADCMSDCFVVAGYDHPNISATYALINYPQKQCKGGDPLKLLLDIERSGIASRTCIDYSWCKNNNKCNGDALDHWDSNLDQLIPQSLPEVSACSTLYYVRSIKKIVCDSTASDNDVIVQQELVKYHIFKHGPVVGGFLVFDDFLDGTFAKHGGIYFEKSQQIKGGHAVVVIGWGVSVTRIPYWICKNSWGLDWGDRGYFRMAMYPHNRYSQFVKKINIDGYKLGGVLTFKPVTDIVKSEPLTIDTNKTVWIILLLWILIAYWQ